MNDSFYGDHFPLSRDVYTRAFIEALADCRDVLLCCPASSDEERLRTLPFLYFGGPCVYVSSSDSLSEAKALSLRARGIKAAALISDMSASKRARLLLRVESLRECVLFIRPDDLLSDDLLSLFERVAPLCVVIDSAHRLLPDDPDFCKSFCYIPEFLASLNRRPHLTVCSRRRDRGVLLRLDDLLELNSTYRCELPFEDPNREMFVEFADETLSVAAGTETVTPSLFICPDASTARSVYASLADKTSCGLYLRGDDKTVRVRAGRDFDADRIGVLVCDTSYRGFTDKSDIRLVTLVGLPDDIGAIARAYYLAGRDGYKSRVRVLYSTRDLDRLKYRAQVNGSKSSAQLLEFLDDGGCAVRALFSELRFPTIRDCSGCPERFGYAASRKMRDDCGDLSELEAAALAELNALRLSFSAECSVPPYALISDKEMLRVVRAAPENKDELSALIGAKRLIFLKKSDEILKIFDR